MAFSKYRSIATATATAIGASAVGGVLSGYITLNYFLPSKWDNNWDRRDPVSMVKRKDTNDPDEENKYQKKLRRAQSKATRHIFLIRHGQYHLKAERSEEKTLTTLGEKQAFETGQRLKELNYPYTKLIRSTMIRATQTAEIIQKFLPDVPVNSCSLLEEGAPAKPEPYPNWPSENLIFVDGPRIEGAFRKYIHRAPPDQKDDSYEIIVCHANVIRYFVCRALQLPSNAWYRIRLNHGSITWLTIHPDSTVRLRELSDTGFMPPDYITIR